ncbi:unnamed protein product [Owenia fusiformis]|uniref:Phospholipid scramblase n=1 Tax=Owenia fusiformis TaxID=6347 RepID=A0A8J1TPW3_OWEFU|nr:unnamed protein product [Owenia fusiformis]
MSQNTIQPIQQQPGGNPPPPQQYEPAPVSQPIGMQPMGGQQPVSGQPQGFMEKPAGTAGCPPGLEYLTLIDQLLVHQQVEMLEVITGFETKNKYQIKNSMGQQIYFAQEESSCCERQCCGPQRGFIMHITDNSGKEVITCTREFKCCAGCCWCACCDCGAMTLKVEANGEFCGMVRQTCSKWSPRYQILDAQDQTIFDIQGPCCVCDGPCCPMDQEFMLLSSNTGDEVGKISKQYTGFVKEAFSTADNFGVNFPMDLDVKMKAVMIGAVFLIDFMFFEEKDNGGEG